MDAKIKHSVAEEISIILDKYDATCPLEKQEIIDEINERFVEKDENLINELKTGYVKISGCDKAEGFIKTCKESEILKIGKKLFEEHPGENGYYNFTKFLWVQFPDNRPECRLDEIVSYE